MGTWKNVNLLFKKLTMQAHKLYSFSLSTEFSRKEKILKGRLIRESHCITIRGESRNFSGINDRAKSCCPFCQKGPYQKQPSRGVLMKRCTENIQQN